MMPRLSPSVMTTPSLGVMSATSFPCVMGGFGSATYNLEAAKTSARYSSAYRPKDVVPPTLSDSTRAGMTPSA
jgi:hypothetical protein